MNGESLTYLVYWDLPLLHTYLYGTTLRHTRDGVEFTNRMMPSGQIIHSWNSELNYQDVRTQAQLPVLEENKTYHLVPFIDAVPEHTIVLQITFFDRQGQQIGFQVIHRDGNFTYPQGAYRYRLEILPLSSPGDPHERDRGCEAGILQPGHPEQEDLHLSARALPHEDGAVPGPGQPLLPRQPDPGPHLPGGPAALLPG